MRVTAEEVEVLDQMWSDLDPRVKARLEAKVAGKRKAYEAQQAGGPAVDGAGTLTAGRAVCSLILVERSS